MILCKYSKCKDAASIAFLENREGGEERRHNLKYANARFYVIAPGRLNLLQKLYNTAGKGKLLVTYIWV
jgi:hypothetical protein